MTTQAFEVQAVTDEELMAANGGLSVPPMNFPAQMTTISSVPSGFQRRGQNSGTPGLGDSNLNAAPTGSLASLG